MLVLLTSFCVHVLGQYLSSPLMICREKNKNHRNKHGSNQPSRLVNTCYISVTFLGCLFALSLAGNQRRFSFF